MQIKKLVVQDNHIMGNSDHSDPLPDPFCDTINEDQKKWDFICNGTGTKMSNYTSMNPQTLDMAILSASIVSKFSTFHLHVQFYQSCQEI